MIRQVTAERGAHRGPHLPIKGGLPVLVKKISVDAHVIHEFALPGEKHLSRGVINADSLAESISTQARTDSQARALMCHGSRKQTPAPLVTQFWSEDVDSVVHLRRVPPFNSVLRSGGQSRRPELLTLSRAAHPRVVLQKRRGRRPGHEIIQVLFLFAQR